MIKIKLLAAFLFFAFTANSQQTKVMKTYYLGQLDREPPITNLINGAFYYNKKTHKILVLRDSVWYDYHKEIYDKEMCEKYPHMYKMINGVKHYNLNGKWIDPEVETKRLKDELKKINQNQ